MMSSSVTITNNFILDYTYQDDHTYMYLVYFWETTQEYKSVQQGNP